MPGLAPLAAAFAAVSLALQGCGGGGGGGPSPAPTPPPTPTPPPGPPAPAPPAPPAPLGPLRPLRAIAYNAAPCTKDDVEAGGACNKEGAPRPGKDLMQEGYEQQWGPKGRDDLGTVAKLGGNAVRLYASMGLETQHDHGKFLDRAQEVGVHVMPGFFTQMACPEFNCFDAWKAATKAAFKMGMEKNGSWHPAVSIVILQDAPDSLNFGGVPPPICPKGTDAKCRVKAALSALDGVLQAEKEAGVKGTANLTIAWSFDTKDSIDGKVKAGIGIYGFQDMVAGVADPSLATYEPVSSQTELQAAFDERWTHSTNTAADWGFVKEKVGGNYDRFMPKPWFLSEFRGDGMSQSAMKKDLEAAEAEAKTGGPFLGVTVYSFLDDFMFTEPQVYGLYGLGPAKTGTTDKVCEEDVNTHVSKCDTWAVYCLNASQGYQDRSSGVASAWGGTATTHGSCVGEAVDAAADETSADLVV